MGKLTKFESALKKVLSVSHEELQRREEQWKREKAQKKRKSTTSASGRASGGKGFRQPKFHPLRQGQSHRPSSPRSQISKQV